MLSKLDLKEFSLTENIIFWTAVLTPIWWLLGIQPLYYPAVALFLFLVNFRISTCIRNPPPLFVWTWFLMSVIALWTAILGLDEIDADLRTVLAAMVTFFKSYLMIFAFLAVPFLCQVRVKVLSKAVAWMLVGLLACLIVQLCLLVIGIEDATFVPPFAKIIPGDAKGLLVKSAEISNFFGIPLPRSLLHTADPPILGAFAFLCTFIVITEEDRWLRRIALTSALTLLVVSFSRSAWVGSVIAVFILLAFQSDTMKQVSLWLSTTVLIVCAVFSLTVQQLIEKPAEVFTSARAASSETRALVVQETMKAWLDKLWLGWGVIRGKAWLYEDKYLKLGSFSTYAAVLYLNGIVGFTIFVFALGSTLFTFFRLASLESFKSQISFALLVILYVLIQATPLSWMAIYLWFFFLWLGAVAAEELQVVPEGKESWSQLSMIYNRSVDQ